MPPLIIPVSYDGEITYNDYFYGTNTESEGKKLILELMINLRQNHLHPSHPKLYQFIIQGDIRLAIMNTLLLKNILNLFGRATIMIYCDR